MLELKNVTKIYKPKKGVPVKALDGVDLKIPDRGMIFILGKSGSGKSTILNLLGGLDTPDSGELIINGKSTNDFTKTDLDSYRNTSVGFVFQEYNVLEEFNIAANIALAIELQGKKATNEELNRILAEVDLEGYGARKPNELSGGQLQRVAIARALIKNPDIIMADEPTGALDSKTGEQVFDTLKKLSRDKAVIVVSHDREFAELYGDRVIELADGKIIDDITKELNGDEREKAGVSFVNEGVIKISGGYTLTDEDWQMIRSKVAAAKCDKYITLTDDPDAVSNTLGLTADRNTGFKKSGANFKETDSERITDVDNADDRKLIKSRLPLRSAFKMGANGLKYKKIRLTVTILTTIISLCLFGMADSMASYDKGQAMYDSMAGNNINYANFSKQLINNGQVNGLLEFNDSDINKLEQESGGSFIPVLNSFVIEDYNLNFANNDGFGNNFNNYYVRHFKGCAELSQSDADALGFRIKGRLPLKSGEVALPYYLFEHYAVAGYKGPTGENAPQGEITVEAKDIGNEENFLNLYPYISINEKPCLITGIIDTKFESSRYDILKTDKADTSYNIYYEFQNEIEYSPHAVIYFSPGSLKYEITRKKILKEFDGYLSSSDSYNHIYKIGAGSDLTAQNLSDARIEIVYAYGKTSLSDNEIIVNQYHLPNYSTYFSQKYDELYNLYPEKEYLELYELAKDYATKEAIENLNDAAYALFYRSPKTSKEISINLKIAGAYINKAGNLDDINNSFAFVSDSVYDKIGVKDHGIYKLAVGRMPEGKNLKNLIALHTSLEYKMHNVVAEAADSYSMVFEIIGDILLYCGLACILLSILLLMNFIASSVAQKSKEIGILRAVGARSRDVFTIFFSESIIISSINFVLGALLSGILVFVVNTVIRNETGLVITIMHFGIRQIGIILAATVLSAFAGSYLPVYKTAKKKPIDAIRKR